MTTKDVIAHWRNGAKDAFEAANLLAKDGKYELAPNQIRCESHITE